MIMTIFVIFVGLFILVLIAASFLAVFRGLVIDPLSDFKNEDD